VFTTQGLAADPVPELQRLHPNTHDSIPSQARCRPVDMWTGSNAACPHAHMSTGLDDDHDCACWVPHETTRDHCKLPCRAIVSHDGERIEPFQAFKLRTGTGLLQAIDRAHSEATDYHEPNKYFLCGYSDLFIAKARSTLKTEAPDTAMP
jgi:hypothetical protein